MKVKDFGQSIDITESEISCINNYWQGTLIAVNDAGFSLTFFFFFYHSPFFKSDYIKTLSIVSLHYTQMPRFVKKI